MGRRQQKAMTTPRRIPFHTLQRVRYGPALVVQSQEGDAIAPPDGRHIRRYGGNFVPD